MAELTLQELQKKMNAIKSEIARKEGERETVLSELKRESGIDSLAKAYKESDRLQDEIDKKKKERVGLIEDVTILLSKYGY